MAAAENTIAKTADQHQAEADFKEAVEEFKAKVSADIFAGLLTRGAATIVFFFLLSLACYGLVTSIPEWIEKLLTKFVG